MINENQKRFQIKRAYDNLKGIENKPNFEEIYRVVLDFIISNKFV